MKLINALNLHDQEMVCFVGAGGKTSLMLKLAEECCHRGKRVLLTTSTKMYRWQMAEQAQLLVEEDGRKLLASIKLFIGQHPVIAAGRGATPDNKILGLAEETIDLLYQSGLFDYVLVEADGANCKPIKAPNEREPVVPSLCTMVIPIVGMDALGSTITPENVHRQEILLQITGPSVGSSVIGETIAKIILHYADLVKSCTPGVRVVPVLNKVDHAVVHENAKEIATMLLSRGIDKVLLTSLLDTTPVREVISTC